MSFLLTLISLFIIADLLWWISTWRRLRTPGLRLLVTLFAVAQLAGLGLILGARWLNDPWATSLPRPLVSAVFLWHMLIALPWLLIFLSTGLVRAVRGLLFRRPAAATCRQGAQAMTRREWIRASATLAPVALTAGGALFGEWQLERFRIRRLTLQVAELPPQLKGLTIAHVTDTHVGHFTKGPVIEEIVRATNELNADLVLMTGDLINMGLRDLPVAMDLVRGLRGRHGVFFCEGNHDLFESPTGFRRGVRQAGLPFLWEESVTLRIDDAHVQVLGSAWAHNDKGHAACMETLRKLRDPKAFPIVLAHHPHAFDFSQGFPLMLAGHTHGGQLMLSENVGFGPWVFRYWSGEYEHQGRTLVVSNGTGNWFPVRINAPAEILHLTLQRA